MHKHLRAPRRRPRREGYLTVLVSGHAITALRMARLSRARPDSKNDVRLGHRMLPLRGMCIVSWLMVPDHNLPILLAAPSLILFCLARSRGDSL